MPLDLGASAVTGMQVNVVYRLRQALGLDPPGTPVKVIEPYQMLGEIAPDLQDALGVDVVGLRGTKTLFGFKNEGWIRIFGQEGGFVFNTIHNVQALVPIENVLALYETVREYGRYPL